MLKATEEQMQGDVVEEEDKPKRLGGARLCSLASLAIAKFVGFRQDAA